MSTRIAITARPIMSKLNRGGDGLVNTHPGQRFDLFTGSLLPPPRPSNPPALSHTAGVSQTKLRATVPEVSVILPVVWCGVLNIVLLPQHHLSGLVLTFLYRGVFSYPYARPLCSTASRVELTSFSRFTTSTP